MTNQELIKALRSIKVETGSLACMGCGHEHNCGIHGCAIMRATADRLDELSQRVPLYYQPRAILDAHAGASGG